MDITGVSQWGLFGTATDRICAIATWGMFDEVVDVTYISVSVETTSMTDYDVEVSAKNQV